MQVFPIIFEILSNQFLRLNATLHSGFLISDPFIFFNTLGIIVRSIFFVAFFLLTVFMTCLIVRLFSFASDIVTMINSELSVSSWFSDLTFQQPRFQNPVYFYAYPMQINILRSSIFRR